MQHPLQISRKIEYGLRAMLCLASMPAGEAVPFREVARRMEVPEDFLAKIFKTLVERGLVTSTRGARGGYCLARPSGEISFLDVIEAVEGPVTVNHCTDPLNHCGFSLSCSMLAVWRLGQEKMLEVYRAAKLDRLAMSDLKGLEHGAPLSA